jgi:hypothetical protein
VSTFDQLDERYLTAMPLTTDYNHIGRLPATITPPAGRRRLDGIRRVDSLFQVEKENHGDKQHNPSNEKGE